jgi:hypothetical protein
MSERPTSDGKLQMLRTKAVLNAHADRECTVTARHLLALVELAEIVQTDYLLLSQEQQMRALPALKVLGV